MIHYEDIERERLDKIYDIIDPHSLMKKHERYFLNGIIRTLKPRKVLEVGVYNGGGSAIILNAISDIESARLYSADYAVKSYTDKNKLIGFLVDDKFPELSEKRKIYRGGDISHFIEEIGSDIDLLVLDTAHIHPWETLNFLCVLPFMKQKESFVVLHDISVHYSMPYTRDQIACRVLFSHVVSDEKVSPVSDYENMPANIGAFKVSEVTRKYAGNLFESLFIPWETEVPEKDFQDISKIIEKYYTSEQYKLFLEAFKFQKYLVENHVTVLLETKKVIRKYHPGIFSVIHAIKHPIKAMTGR